MDNTHTQTSGFTPPPNPSQTGTPLWLYDEIMRHIEPDLISSMLPKHAAMYASETKDQRVARMQSYDKAFAAFDHVEKEFEKAFFDDIKKVKEQVKSEAMKEEKVKLTELETEIQNNK